MYLQTIKSLMLANYFDFKKQYKTQHSNKGWTKVEFWKNLEIEWNKIKDLPIEKKVKSKPAKPFPFQQFTVQQSDDVFKVGTDGVLLGSWTNNLGARNVLEIGAGTGYISLMMAQRNTYAVYDALEIMEPAFKLAQQNFKNNPWNTEMNVFHQPFQEFKSSKAYDVIACDPPYFENSTLSGHKEIDIARHKLTLTYDGVVEFAKTMLTQSGILTMIIPYNQKKHLEQVVSNNAMYIQKEMIIQGTPTVQPKRYMVQIGNIQKSLQTEHMIIESNGRHFHSPEFIELTKEYYNYFIPESLQYKIQNV